MIDPRIFTIAPNVTIKEAMERLEEIIDDFRTLFVLDHGKIVGTLEDGDIRRALIKRDISIHESVTKVCHPDPVVLKCGQKLSTADIQRLARYQYVPRVDEMGIVVDFVEIDNYGIRLPNRAVIMAGGRGSRLGALTRNIPKPMLTVGTKPLLEIIIEQFKAHNIKDLYISLNFNPNAIRDYFGDGKEFGVKITYIEESKKMGTAGCLGLIKEHFEEPFFVMNGDILTDLDFASLLQFHKENSNVATMCAVEHSVRIPFGVIESKNKRIVQILEKPVRTFLVNAGIYLLNPECLQAIPHQATIDMPTLFNNLIIDEKFTGVYSLPGFWLDIGHPEDLKKADQAYKSYFQE